MARPTAETPLRSFLFSPGSSEKMLSRAPSSGADAALLDLEDSVAPDMKETARGLVRDAIAAVYAARGKGGPSAILVRVNGADTEYIEGDLEAIVTEGLDALFLPKPESGADVRKVDAILTRLERDRGFEEGGIGIIAQMESAAGVFNTYDICTASPRMVGVNFGSAEDADLCRDLGVQWTPNREGLLYAQSKVLLEARASGMPHPTDGVYMRIKDEAGCREDAEQAKRFGYVGKAAIHPVQVGIYNEVFTPTPEEIEYYTGMLEAFREGEKAGLGAISFKGRMIDVAMAKHAERIVGRAKVIAGK